jgi:FixJ family two-component response regulator
MNHMISIIEDDPHVRQATINLMRSLGIATVAFGSAEEFLASDRADDAECLIVDVQLPGLSGVELQERLRAQGKTTPVIFITAFSDERIRLSAMGGGAIGFLGKPFDTRSLIDCLDRALPGRAAVAGRSSAIT